MESKCILSMLKLTAMPRLNARDQFCIIYCFNYNLNNYSITNQQIERLSKYYYKSTGQIKITFLNFAV